jgi:hypothetical protein
MWVENCCAWNFSSFIPMVKFAQRFLHDVSATITSEKEVEDLASDQGFGFLGSRSPVTWRCITDLVKMFKKLQFWIRPKLFLNLEWIKHLFDGWLERNPTGSAATLSFFTAPLAVAEARRWSYVGSQERQQRGSPFLFFLHRYCKFLWREGLWCSLVEVEPAIWLVTVPLLG